MFQNEPWEAIAAQTEVHSTRKLASLLVSAKRHFLLAKDYWSRPHLFRAWSWHRQSTISGAV